MQLNRYLILATALAYLVADSLSACPKCADSGTIEQRETCVACNGKGKTANTKESPCPRCRGSGRSDRTRYQGTFCRGCNGSGVRSDSSFVTCEACGGTGVTVSRILCPTCKGSSAVNGMGVAAEGGGVGGTGDTPSVDTVAVGACTRCDAKGNISYKVECKICDHGWNHLKNDSGTHVCRKCGAECKTRFSACACAKPDCPHCKGEYEKMVSEVCPFCGGDKIVTPLEREKAKKGVMKK